MNVILDITFSFIIRASVVLVVLMAVVNLNNELYRQTDRVVLNDNLVSASQTISNDILLAGYGSGASKTFATAQSTDMSFTADLDNSGVNEVVRYYLSPEPTGSQFILMRTIDGGSPFEITRDVFSLQFSYYDRLGTVKSGTSVTGITSVKVSIMLESNHRLSSVYSDENSELTPQRVKWEGQFFPPNL